MPRLEVLPRAVAGLERCQQFLANRGRRDPHGVVDARAAIRTAFNGLREGSAITRLDDDDPACRILVIPFRKSGYLAQVQYDQVDDVVYVTAFRHQLEEGFKP